MARSKAVAVAIAADEMHAFNAAAITDVHWAEERWWGRAYGARFTR